MDNIEIEFRSEIPIEDIEKHIHFFKNKATFLSHTKRLTVMGVLNLDNVSLNLRVRITKDVARNSSSAEFVLKKGFGHAHNRIEIPQPIAVDEVVGLAHIIAEVIPDSIILFERETYNFKADNGIDIALVKASKHAYIEYEKLCAKKDEQQTKQIVLDQIKEWEYTVLDKEQSLNLFHQLDTEDDVVIKAGTFDITNVQKYVEDYL